MQISDKDIWRSAKILVDQHGDVASIEASSKADKMLEAGDLDGQRVWLRILSKVKELQKLEPGEVVH